MPLNLDAALNLKANVVGQNAVRQMDQSLSGLQKATQLSKSELGRWNIEINRSARAAGNTTAGIRAHAQALTQLQSRVDVNSKAYSRLGAEIDSANAKLKALSRTQSTVKGGMSTGVGAGLGAGAGLMAGLGPLLALAAGGTIVAKVFGSTAELQTQTRSLETLTGSALKAGEIVRQLREYGAATPFETTELIDTAKKLTAFGVEAAEVVDVTKRLGDVAGASGAKIDDLALIYGQVMSKGRVQTEELLQFQERGIGVQAELQKMYGMTGAELQKAISAGKVPAEALEVAFIRLTNVGGKYAGGALAQSDTLNGRLSTLNDSVTILAQTIGSTLTPAMIGALNVAIELTGGIQRAFDRLTSFQAMKDDKTEYIGREKLKRAGVEPTYTDSFGNLYSTSTGRMIKAGPPRRMTTTPATPKLTAGTSGGTAKKPKGDGTLRLRGGSAAEQQVFGILKARGMNENQIAAVMGSIQQESGFNPAAREAGGTGLGLFQWSHTRRNKVPRLTGNQSTDINNQMALFFSELSGSESAAGRRLMGAGSLKESALGMKDYERYGIAGNRYKYMDAFKRRISGSGGGSGLAGDMADEEAKAAKNRSEGLAAATRSAEVAGRALAIDKEKDELAKLNLVYQDKYLKLVEETNKLKADAQSVEEQQQIDLAAGLENERMSLEYGRERLKILEERRDLEAELPGLIRAQGEEVGRIFAMTSGESPLTVSGGITAGLDAYITSVGTAGEQTQAFVEQGLGGFSDALVDLATTGSADFGGFAASLLKDMARIITQTMVLIPLMQTLQQVTGGGGGGGNSLAAFAPGLNLMSAGPMAGFNIAGSLLGFAGGGYTGSAPRTGGLDGQGGFMAMLHPQETVVDHTRGGGAAGGVTNNISVKVDAGNTKAGADPGMGASLARDLAQVIDARLAHHRRAGGLLS